MTTQLILPIWPNCYECVCWSKDNQLAIFGGESVMILTPRFGAPGPDGNLWDTTTLTVNTFRKSEVYVSDPLSFRNFSVGEELSPWQLVAGAWSTCGLGLYGSFALGLLTSNHVLSLWTFDGLPAVKENWRREVVVNLTIREFYETQEIPSGDALFTQEWEIVRQRVLGFSWSSMLHDELDNAVAVVEHLSHGPQLLAVTTEGGHVLVMQVQNSYNHRGLHKGWKVSVVASFDVAGALAEDPRYRLHHKETGALLPSKLRTATKIVWGDWRQGENGRQEAILAFVAVEKLCTIRLSVIHQASNILSTIIDSTSFKIHIPIERIHPASPLLFVPSTTAPTCIAFGENVMVQLDTDSGTCSTHHLDDRWDEVTGAAFSQSDDNAVLVNIISHLTSSSAPTAQLVVPFETGVARIPSSPPWRQAIISSKSHFSDKHGLKEKVLDRTWGMASSPLSDYIATASTIHPSESLAYIIPSDYTTYINISAASTAPGAIFRPGATAGASNAVLFTLQRFLERTAPAADADAREATAIQLLRHTLLPIGDDDLNITPTPERNWINKIRSLRSAIYLHYEMQTLRISRIAKLAVNHSAHQGQIDRAPVTLIIKEILRFAHHHKSQDHFSDRMLSIYTIIAQKLGIPFTETPANAYPEPASQQSETCTICQQSIPFESLKWARCTSGHQFTRCALSFLSIQQPGRTKHCSICGLGYLKEIPESTASDEGTVTGAGADGQRTLAAIVFAACHVCVYCGGRFV